MSAINYVPADSQLTVVCRDDLSAPAVAIRAGDLIPEFSIRVFRSPHEWSWPAMVGGASQTLSVKINLAFLSLHPAFDLHKSDHMVKLELYAKQFNTQAITPFYQFTQKQIDKTLLTDQVLQFVCRFRIDKGYSSIKGERVYMLALQIDRLRILYLAEDIFVASNNKQLKEQLNVGIKIKESLRSSTFWFSQMEMQQRVPPKRDFSQIATASEREREEEEREAKRLLSPPPGVWESLYQSPGGSYIAPISFEEWGLNGFEADFPDGVYQSYDQELQSGFF